MNNEVNQNNNNEPIVLGELKKEKSSKPFFVFIVFLLVLGTCFGLPYIQDYLNNGEGPIVDYYNKIINYFSSSGDNNVSNNKTSNKSTTITTTTKIEENDGFTLLKSDTILNVDNIYLDNIKINNNTLSYRIMAKKSDNLNSTYYYLEIYNSDKELLGKVKLSGDVSSASKDLSFNLLFDASSSSYYLKLINVENLSDLNVETLSCIDKSNTYTYTFENNQLIIINHVYTNSNKSNLNSYESDLKRNKEKSSLINSFTNSLSSVTENDNGFSFKANLYLNNIKLSDLGEYVDYNYYDYGTLSKIINYEITIKGFDCK